MHKPPIKIIVKSAKVQKEYYDVPYALVELIEAVLESMKELSWSESEIEKEK